MDFSTNFKICGAGLSVQRTKMDVIVSNLANLGTTRTPEGGPYKRKVVTLSSVPVEGGFNQKLKDAVKSVEVRDIVEDQEGIKRIFDPGHPDADQKGYVAMPNVNIVSEMADMIIANRAYEALVTAFDSTKNMALKALDIGK
ncbi:MAG: flagellar basal body rod protein FlgC [Syntrophales bacterium]